MTYREPDPKSVAEAERQLEADEKIEQEAAAGRAERAKHEKGIEKRLVRGRWARRLAVGAAPSTAWFTAYMAAIFAGATVPIAVGTGAGAAVLGAAGAAGIGALQRRRELAWVHRQPFPILGYLELLQTRLVTALVATVTLATSEPEDRERVVDLLGKLDTVDPVVKLDGDTMTIETLIAGSTKAFARGLVEKVLVPLHELRGIKLVQLAR